MDKKVSDNALDYAAFIVYYQKKHEASDKLVAMCAPFGPEIILQDILDIAKDARPAWLTGVPTVVSLPSYVIHRGSAAIAAIQDWSDGQLGGMEPKPKGSVSLVPSAPLTASDQKSMPLLAEDARYSDGKTKKRSQEADFGQPSSIEELMRLRAPKTDARF